MYLSKKKIWLDRPVAREIARAIKGMGIITVSDFVRKPFERDEFEIHCYHKNVEDKVDNLLVKHGINIGSWIK